MKTIKRLLSLFLVLSLLLTSGIVEAAAITVRKQKKSQPAKQETVPVADLSDMFVVEETQPMEEPEITQPTQPEETVSAQQIPDVPKRAVTGQADSFSYEVLEDGTCCITGYSGDTYENLQIPETLDGYTVTAVGDGAFKKKTIVSISFPAGVTKIGANAFENCTGLESISLGNSLTNIGSRAFASCTALEELELPDTVKTIGSGAFANCTSLSSWRYPLALETVNSNLSGGIFGGCTSLTSVEVPEGVTALPNNVFQNTKPLQSVKLPSTLKTIGEYAFDGSGITSVTLPDGFTSIGSFAFKNCSALESIQFGENLTSIGTNAFASCTALTELNLPDTVKKISSGAFANCTSLSSWHYPLALETVGSNLSGGIFGGCTSLTSVEVPEGVTALPANVFQNTKPLQSVKLPSTLKTIGDYAFDESGITSLKLPDGVTKIGDWAFDGCVELESIVLGNSLTNIGTQAFANCTALEELELPDTVKTIGSGAFSNCTSLSSWHYPLALETVGSNLSGGIFGGCTSLTSVEVPEGVTALPANVFQNTKPLKTVTLPSTLKTIGDYAFDESGITSLTLPDGLTGIGNFALKDCSALKSIQLGESLTTIGTNAFAGCTGLTELNLPDTVKKISSGAFANCTSLSSWHYPLALETVGSNLSGGIFGGCTLLTEVEVPEGVTALPANVFQNTKPLKTVTLPSTLKTIGDYAFDESGITSLTLPDGLTGIGNFALKDCSALKSIQLGESLTNIGTQAFSNCTALEELNLPDTVKKIGSGAFANCVGLKEMTLPDALTTIGSGAFERCTALESVIFSEGVTELESNIFNGCSSLRNVHLPRNLRQIWGSAFANCAALTEIYIADTVTWISDNAFQGVPGITFMCALDSYATEFALDHQYPIIPTKLDDQQNDSPLNTENSYYIHNYDSISAAGVMSMTAHYEMKENAAVSPTAITIHIYDYAALQENTLTLDGVLCTNYEYDQETGRLTVPVEEKSGTLRFCLKPLRYEAFTSYARLICKEGWNNTSVEVIGAVNALMPVLNISARTETSLSSVDVSGVAIPGAEVSLYVDGVFNRKVKANKVGDYSAVVSLGEPVDGKTYVIKAEAADRSGAVVTAETTVTYRNAAPELVDFVMIHNDRRITLEEMQNTRPVVIFRQSPFRFEINFTPAEGLKDVYVVSTRNNVKKYMRASWDEELGIFVAEGYFDPQDHSYVPGKVDLEYVYKGEKVSFDQPVDLTSPEAFAALPQIWKDAQVQILDNTEQCLEAELTMTKEEQELSFTLRVESIGIPAYLTEENIEQYGYTKLTDDYGKTVYMKIGGTEPQRPTRQEEEEEPEGAKPVAVEIVDFAADQAKDYTVDKVNDSFGDLTGLGDIFDMFDILKAMDEMVKTGEEYSKIFEDYCNRPDVSYSQIHHFNEQVKQAQLLNALTTFFDVTLTVVGIAAPVLIPGAGVIISAASFGLGILLDMIRAYIGYDLRATAYGLDEEFKYAVDPSGYVYDKVTGQRLSGVTVHAYWIENPGDDPNFWDNKPAEDEYGVLWAAGEYSQMNPLFTDGNGRYAWDVPEGWWRVSYEKEGYETVWSEWLPVPPPQTEVNIGMVRIGGYVPGDVNDDGFVDSLDGLMILQYLNGWSVVIPNEAALDVSGDGVVNSLDGLLLVRYLNGWNISIG